MSEGFVEQLNLNDIQKEAVVYDGGAQLVFAGAGTGKTRVLTAKIAWLIKEKGIRPNNIFAATFTNKAAGEMKERVAELIGMPCDSLWIGTFHSLCVRILRREADKIGFSRYFSIYDSSDQLALVKNCMKEAMVDEKALQPKAVLHTISSYKNKCLTPEKVEKLANSYYEREIATLFGLYQKGLKQADAMDFDDLIGHVVALFIVSPEAVLCYQNMFRYILVDEYQDTNGAQFQLIKSIAGGSNPVFAVGDDDQSIYGWRGAQVKNILSFEQFFQGTRIFKLEQNYRSSQAILDFANGIISQNSERADKKLWTSSKAGVPVVVQAFSDDRKEATSISDSIEKLLKKEAKASDVAILFRTNAQSRLFEEHLRKRNIPYVLVGGTSFYERKEIKDVLAYMKLLVNPKDSISCQRILNVPARGIGAISQEKIVLEARQQGVTFSQLILSGEGEAVVRGKAQKGVSAFRLLMTKMAALQEEKNTPEYIVSELLADSGYVDQLTEMQSEDARARIENINELLNAIAEWTQVHPLGTIAQFLEEITLASSVDNWDGEHSVSLMTLHTAKGLEFPYVYVVGVEDGLLPARQNMDDPAKLEEERRLLYVGATRAEKKLVCSYAETRMRFGSIMPMGMSRFLETLPATLYELIDETAFFTTMSWDDEFPPPVYKKKQVSASSSSAPTYKRRTASAESFQRSSFPSSISQAPVVDEFNQDTVQLRMGQKVRHAKFGVGKVLNMSGFGPEMRITVLFDDGQRKQMIAKFAKFEIV